MSAPVRLYVPADLASGAMVALDEAQSHYLRNVMRLNAGDAILLFNGKIGEWRARIETLGKKSANLICLEQTREQRASPDLWLLFAPLKRARIDLVAEKAGELGVSRLIPVITARTDSTRVNTGRLRAHAIQAAEQCERLDVPIVDEPRPLDRVLSDWDKTRRLILAAEAGPANPACDVLPAMAGQPAAILIGPEGGFTEAELEDLVERSYVDAIRLGPRILRAETAAIASLSLWQGLCGDWRILRADRTKTIVRPLR
ncbi:MAG: 16S rRNA (uracil(1498)-N(3))-methyltransferase [Pseudomonadota bacterium]|nr:16S rRNA (uracil(1498)-N(3))-methyltransferase [Pseudomonadota bacterium]